MTCVRRLARVVPGVMVSVLAADAVAGPDFVSGERAAPLAASDARSEQEPMEDLVFARDSAAFLPAAQTQLAVVATWLDFHPGHRLVVEGRADSSGTAEYNEALATRRIEVVRRELLARGVASDRIVLAVYGENGARRRPDPLDRRVVMFASAAPLGQLVSAELDHDAIALVWTRDGAQYRETRGITPVATIAARR